MNHEMLLQRGFDTSQPSDADNLLTIGCSQCDATFINGHPCHERGCRNSPVECRECGTLHPDRDGAALCCAPCDDEQEGEES